MHPHALEGALVSLAAMWRLPVLHSLGPEHSLRILQFLADQTSKPQQRLVVEILNDHLTWLTRAAVVVIMTTWLDVPQLAPASSRLASEGTYNRFARAGRS